MARSPYGSEILQVCAHILLGNSAFPAGILWKWGHPHSQRYRSKSQAAWLGFTLCSLWLLKKIIRRHRKKASVKALARSRQTRVPGVEEETRHTTPHLQSKTRISTFRTHWASKGKMGCGMGGSLRTVTIGEIILINQIYPNSTHLFLSKSCLHILTNVLLQFCLWECYCL